jgi:hypothetical protein
MDVLTHGVAHAKQRRIRVARPAAMNEQPRGLVGDHQVCVDEQELDVRADAAGVHDGGGGTERMGVEKRENAAYHGARGLTALNGE